MTISWKEAKAKFEELAQHAARGDEVLIQLEDGRLLKLSATLPTRRFGSAQGKVWISEDFDEVFEEYR